MQTGEGRVNEQESLVSITSRQVVILKEEESIQGTYANAEVGK